MEAPPETIVTSLVALRRAGPADSQAIFRASGDPEVARFMDWSMPRDSGPTEAHLHATAADWEKGLEYRWVIIERCTGESAGTISGRPKDHAADFGYFLARKYWGKGLATEASRAVVSWLMAQPEIVRVWATVDAENTRSRRVLERVGLTLEGVLRMATVRPNLGGAPRDTAIYPVTRSPVRDRGGLVGD
jgi:ribosomal-protein-alanine N-acetyltransferase